MALVIAHAELVSDQTSDPRTAPQRRREAVRLGAFQQQRLEAFELRGVQQRLTAGAAGLTQPGFAVTPVSSQPLADALPRDLQSPRCLGLTTALLDQPDRFETALLQGLEIPPYAFCISHTYKDVRTPKRCHFVLRDSISSFDKTQASHNGRKSHAVNVRCVRFRDVIKQYGTPHYAKIDIEGSDLHCLYDLDRVTAPDYISVELGHSSAEMIALGGLGYTAFKCINQRDFGLLRHEGRGFPTRLRGALRSHHPTREFGASLSAKLRRAKHKLLNQYRRLTQPVPGLDWTFEEGSSGPFGEQTDGEWQSLEEACHAWLHYLLGHSKFGRDPEWTYWHDVHAKRGRNRISRCDSRDP